MRESLTGAITDAGAGAGAIMGAKTGSGAIAAKACYAVSLTVGNQEFMYLFGKLILDICNETAPRLGLKKVPHGDTHCNLTFLMQA